MLLDVSPNESPTSPLLFHFRVLPLKALRLKALRLRALRLKRCFDSRLLLERQFTISALVPCNANTINSAASVVAPPAAIIEEIKVFYTPKISVYECRQNVNKLEDASVEIRNRYCTFDGPIYNTRKSMPSTHSYPQRPLPDLIARHFACQLLWNVSCALYIDRPIPASHKMAIDAQVASLQPANVRQSVWRI